MIDTRATTPCACESRRNLRRRTSAHWPAPRLPSACANLLPRAVPQRAPAAIDRQASPALNKPAAQERTERQRAGASSAKTPRNRSALASSAPTATVNTPRPTSDKNSRRVPGKVIKSSRFLFRLLSSYYGDCRAGQCLSVALITRQVEFSHRLRAPAFHV
jgi:hypothetical protein